MKLSDKQQRFVDEYLIDQNAAAAARRAGYSERTAKEIGAENLTKPHIAQKIQAGLAQLAKQARLTAEDAWAESKCIAKSDIGDIIDFSGIHPKLKPANQISEAARRAIKSVKVKRYVEGAGESARDVELMEFTFWDKPGQLNTTLKALGELKDKVEHTGKDGGPIEHSLVLLDVTSEEFKSLPVEERLRRLREAIINSQIDPKVIEK